ncbi:3-ketoacyl-ACP reductase [Planococcus plakortidis]|uniref:3-ketoacyl-ACP reductase n=1 Tax=Planococcus plakortidis TaxID=1038856 RepID=A0A1C7E5N0_9BACL|nr:glucose 1-dehydrogenase [Planococcus plakortidis]ANU18782.1 3-ketoacyl-ACP reductase [Planococcus plakortidis]
MEIRLDGKTAIITGAGGGMGKAAVERFLESGANVAALDIRTESLGELKKRYQEKLLVIDSNLTEQASVEAAFKEINEAYGRIDILANVAGIAQSATDIEEVSLEMWERIFSINTKAVFLTSRAAVPYMKRQGSGAILNVASISVERPRPGLNAYIASKGATVSLTKALAIELAPHHIRVNCVNPGPSDTQMLGEFTAAGADVESMKENTFRKSVPLGDLIQPQDIANALLYMSSDLARMMTGSVVNVDGGRGI